MLISIPRITYHLRYLRILPVFYAIVVVMLWMVKLLLMIMSHIHTLIIETLIILVINYVSAYYMRNYEEEYNVFLIYSLLLHCILVIAILNL